jgi:hypothetical protein
MLILASKASLVNANLLTTSLDPKNEPRRSSITSLYRLGSVAGPVIQATGRSKFEDGLQWGRVTLCQATHMA